VSTASLHRRFPLLLLFGGVVWIVAVLVGFAALEQEEFTPVASTSIQGHFPAHAGLHLSVGKPSLFLFVHPYCPCSRASLHEMDSLQSSISGRAAVTVVFTIPPGLAPGWKESDLWKTANALPGVSVFIDQDGVEATRFGVKGSGHALLYGPSGQLLFSGGITPSRGHEGENRGCTAISELVLSGHSLVSHTPVFGCSLL